MLSGILYSSWQLALLAIIGNIISTATAWICSYSREDIKKWTIRIQWYFSRYRHRSIYRDNMAINVASANNFALSTWITYLFSLQHRLSGYTAPFIFVCMDITDWMSLDISFIIIVHPPLGAEPSSDFLRAFCLNIGQVMFQGNSISGLFFADCHCS